MILPFLSHSLLVNAAAYVFWDVAMRHGDIALMGSAANALPITSILFAVWYLGEPLTPGLLVGGALVAAGAILCRRGAPKETE
jgi:drug/metabolite transporter (DMT)-like permease